MTITEVAAHLSKVTKLNRLTVDEQNKMLLGLVGALISQLEDQDEYIPESLFLTMVSDAITRAKES